MLKNTHIIRTPENVEFTYTVAGLTSRLLAWIIDRFLIATLSLIGLFILAASTKMDFIGGVTSFLGLVIRFLGVWGYFVFCEWYLAGRTPGKRALGLRVIGDGGFRITFFQSALRNLLRAVDNLLIVIFAVKGSPALLLILYFFPSFIMIGALTAWINRQGKRVGDLVAGTVVVEEVKREVPSVMIPPRERFNSLIDDRMIGAAVNLRLSPKEQDLLIALCLRRDGLKITTRLELFTKTARHLQQKTGIVKPQFFSDERFVLNITAIILEGKTVARPRPNRDQVLPPKEQKRPV